MGLGTNTDVRLINAPRIESVTSGLQNAILGAQQNARLREQDKVQAIKSLEPIAEQNTIRNVLANQNQTGGVQQGLESQQQLNQYYVDLQNNYDKEKAALKQQGFDIAKGVTHRDPEGNVIKDPALEALAKRNQEIDLAYDSKLSKLNQAAVEGYKNNPGMLDTVTNPADYEKRLADAFMAKGLSADKARLEAKKEAAPYYAPKLTDRQKLQVKEYQDRRKGILDNPAINQSQTVGVGSPKSSGSSKYNIKNSRNADAIGLAKNWASLSPKDKGWFSLGDNAQEVADTVAKALASDPSGLISKRSWEQALSEITKGTDNRFFSLDRRIGSADELLQKAKEIELANPYETKGSGGTKGGNYSSVTTRNKGYSKTQLQTMDKINSGIDAILSGGRNKTVAEALGKKMTAIGNKYFLDKETSKKDAKVPTGGTPKAKSMFSGTDVISTAMRSKSGDGALVKALRTNPEEFNKAIDGMSDKQLNAIAKTLSTKKNIALLEALGTDIVNSPSNTTLKPTIKVDSKAKKSLDDTLGYNEGDITKLNKSQISTLQKTITSIKDPKILTGIIDSIDPIYSTKQEKGFRKYAETTLKAMGKEYQPKGKRVLSGILDTLSTLPGAESSRTKFLTSTVLRHNPDFNKAKVSKLATELRKASGKDASEKELVKAYKAKYRTNSNVPNKKTLTETLGNSNLPSSPLDIRAMRSTIEKITDTNTKGMTASQIKTLYKMLTK